MQECMTPLQMSATIWMLVCLTLNLGPRKAQSTSAHSGLQAVTDVTVRASHTWQVLHCQVAPLSKYLLHGIVVHFVDGLVQRPNMV